MSKGSKQIRMGRVEKVIADLEHRLKHWEEMKETEANPHYVNGVISGLKKAIVALKDI